MSAPQYDILLSTEELAREFTTAHIPEETHYFDVVFSFFKQASTRLREKTGSSSLCPDSLATELSGLAFDSGVQPSTCAVVATLFASLSRVESVPPGTAPSGVDTIVKDFAKQFGLPQHLVKNLIRVVEAQAKLMFRRALKLDELTLTAWVNGEMSGPLDQERLARLNRKQASSPYDIFVHHLEGRIKMKGEKSRLAGCTSDTYNILRGTLKRVGRAWRYEDIVTVFVNEQWDALHNDPIERARAITNKIGHLKRVLSEQLDKQDVSSFLDTSQRRLLRIGKVFKTCLIDELAS